MLTWSQIHKENNYHIHEDVEVDTAIGDGDVVNTHDHAGEGVETLYEYVRSKDENLLGVYFINSKVYGLVSKGTMSLDDKTPHNNEDFNLSGLDMEQFMIDKSGNIMLHVEEDGILCDIKTFDPIFHLGAIKLLLRMSCIINFKLY